MRTARFAVAFGPRRIARPVALSRASLNRMLVTLNSSSFAE
jgi:hypothetical protein